MLALATAIRLRREELRLTRKCLADHLSVVVDDIILIESGKVDLDIAVFVDIARFLEISSGELMLSAEELQFNEVSEYRMQRRIQTQLQMDTLQAQHTRLLEQSERIKRQFALINDKAFKSRFFITSEFLRYRGEECSQRRQQQDEKERFLVRYLRNRQNVGTVYGHLTVIDGGANLDCAE